ncbi:MAG: hypothetical protein ACTHWH_08270 [Marinobacter sp.]
MAIKKEKLHANFTMIPNSILRDSELPLDTIGLLVYLLSQPEDWEVRATQIQKEFKVGREKRQRMYKQLENAGHLVQLNGRGVDGRWTTETIIYQVPQN